MERIARREPRSGAAARPKKNYLADEFGSRSIRCNAVAPGFIETDMTQVLPEETKKAILAQIPLKRMGSAEEVANVVLFLSSEASTYVTGQVISVCGGMSR